MKEFFLKNWGDIASVLFIVGSLWGIITRQYNKLHLDIQEIKEENKRAHSRIDDLQTSWNSRFDTCQKRIDDLQTSWNSRFDACQQRIDNLYKTILSLLQKSEK